MNPFPTNTQLARLIIALFFPFVLYPQSETLQSKEFDSIFYDTAVKVSAIDIHRAERIADSLYKNAVSDIQKIKSLMLSADLLEKQGKRNKSIEYVLLADSIAIENKNYEWKARISGFLSTQYRIIGLIDQGKKYLAEGMEASEKIPVKSVSNQFKALVYQEMAHYSMYDSVFTEAVRLLKKAHPLFSDLKNDAIRNYYYGTNEEMLGENYVELAMLDSANYHFKNALKFIHKADAGNSDWAGKVYHGLGRISLENEELAKALKYLQRADTIAESLNHKQIKEKVYRDLSKYYMKIGDLDNYARYNTKYLKIIEEGVKAEQQAANSRANLIYEKFMEELSYRKKSIGIIILLILVVTLFFYMTIRKRKKDREHYKAIIAQLTPPVKNKDAPEVSNAKEVPKSGSIMSRETELEIVQKLEQFEKDTEFISNDLSLPILSAKLKVNTRYLSYVINKHKKKDFSNYVNELRVLYFIKKIQENPSYLNYKISYLSSECGFTSHSMFSKVFKNVTGLTPSSFLNQVQKENNRINRTKQSIS